MISGILTATILVGCVGLFIGIFLGIAGIKFKVETDERIEYFDSIESILGIIYADFAKMPFKERIKAFSSTDFTPRTSKERFGAMKRIKEFVPKLKTSWIEKC